MENELGNATADLEMAAYAAAAVDTMEVMEQPLYEIFDRLRQILKAGSRCNGIQRALIHLQKKRRRQDCFMRMPY